MSRSLEIDRPCRSCEASKEAFTAEKKYAAHEPERLFPKKYYKQGGFRRVKTISLITFIITLLVCFFTTIKYTVDEVEIRSVDSRFFNSNITSVLEKQNNTYIDEMKVEIRVLSANLLNSQVKCHVSFFPSTGLVLTRGQINTPILVYLGYYQNLFPENSTMSPVEVVFPILSGSTSYYPFDEFHTEIAVEITDVSTLSIIPVHVTLQAGTPSLQFNIAQTKQNLDGSKETSQIDASSSKWDKRKDDISKYLFRLSISRPLTVIFFSIFVIIIMWALSLAIVAVTFNIMFLTPHRPDPSFLGVGSSLLFAMPNLRETQPGVPPIGIIIDAIGFFWNMALIAICSVAILWIWTKRRDATKIIL